MKIAWPLVVLSVLTGCALHPEERHNPDLTVIDAHLGGRFQIMGPVEASEVARLTGYSESQQEKVKRFVVDGLKVYFVFGPDWETTATDSNGDEVFFAKVARVIVLRERLIIDDFSAEEGRANKRVDTTPVSRPAFREVHFQPHA